MKKQFHIATIIILINSLPVFTYGQAKIQITTTKSDSVNTYGISEFYFVHQLFADAFFLTDLYKQLDYDEMTQIIKTTLYKIDKDNRVTVIIKQAKGPDAKLIFLIKEGTKNGTLLALMTNFHAKKRIFTEDMDEQNSVARWYFIYGNKLVYRKDLYSKETENEIKKQAPHKLIDYYLFDDNVENDTNVKELIDNIMNNAKSTKIELLYAKLYLGEFYLFNSEIEKAEEEINALKEFYIEYKDNGIPPQYSLITNMAQTELEIMKRIKKVE